MSCEALWEEFADPTSLDEDRFWRSGTVLGDNLVTHIRLADTQSPTVVEIGCGNGRVTHRLAQRFREVWALDISPEIIAHARERWGHLADVRFVVNSGAELAASLGPAAPFEALWDRGFTPRADAGAAAPPSAIVTSRVWAGSRIPVGALRRAARSAGLEVERAEGEGTFWTFLTLRRSERPET